MFLKSFGVVAPVGLAFAYFTGVLGGGYSREIEQPLPVVMAALSHGDIRKQPGSPGTEATRSGGVMPVFRTDTTTDSVVWTVMSGDKVAITMTAKLEPIDDGRGTRVTGTVERGDADPDLVSPAFRSTGISKALFASMIESELGELMAARSRQAGPGGRPHTMADGIRTVMEVNALHGEYLRTGKDPLADDNTRIRMAMEAAGEDDAFRPVLNRMGAAPAPEMPGVNLTPGEPMIDPSRPTRDAD